MYALCLLLCLILHVASSDCRRQHENIIDVDPENPNSTNDSSCFEPGNHPCVDINFALTFPGRRYSTAFVLSNTTHHLATIVSNNLFTNTSKISFYGPADNGLAVVECMEGAGLAFIDSSEITVSRITFKHCGALRNSTSQNFTAAMFQLMQIRVGLYFYNCQNVNITSASVVNSYNAIGVVMYNTAGSNFIADSHFNFNGINNSVDSGGGGLAVEFTYCRPGDNNCNTYHRGNTSNALYLFENCSFNYNSGKDQTSKNGSGLYVLPKNRTHSSLGRGGGLSLYFKGAAENNNVTIDNCHFIRNHADWGGGLLVEFDDVSIHNTVQILNSKFHKNHCYFEKSSSGASGGGVRVASSVFFTTKPSKTLQRNSVSLQGCNFTENRALSGGGLSLSYHRQPLSYINQLFHINVSDSIFDHNSARIGSAISVEHEHFYSTGEIGSVTVTNCIIIHNNIVYAHPKEPYSVGIGAVYIAHVSVAFKGQTSFLNNNGTALAIVGATVSFLGESSVDFKGNLGSNGGAIALLGIAHLVVGENSTFNFVQNSAMQFGGAIYNNYVGQEDLRSSIKCFLQYSDPFSPPSQWRVKFNFTGNTAEKLGQSIYSSTILPCSWSDNLEAELDIAKEIFCWNSSIWIYEESNCSEQINTSPANFDHSRTPQNIFPGHRFYLRIKALDDLMHDVSNQTIYTAVTKDHSTAVVDPKFAYIADGYLGINGKEDEDVVLELNVAASRNWHLQVNFTMNKCPVGLKLKNTTSISKMECICNPNNTEDIYSFGGNLVCEQEKVRARIRNGFWIGYIKDIDNGTTLVMATTVLLFQHDKQKFIDLPRNHSDSDFFQCTHLHGTGPLCSNCTEGFATAVNSYKYECTQCNNSISLALNITKYVALTYVPYLLFCVLIIYFDVRLMSGPAVGFILYAQVIGSGVFDLPVNSLPYSNGVDYPDMLHKAFRAVYGIFSLNSFSYLLPPFCINKRFSALDVILLDLAVAAFPLLLILLIRLLMPLQSIIKLRRKRRDAGDATTATTKHTNTANRRTLVHSFVGFIYLSYSQFTLASVKLLSTTGLIKEDGSRVSEIKLLYYAGHYQFGEMKYMLPYGVIALLTFVFFAVFLPLLLMGPFQFINWLIDKPRFQFLNRCWPTLRINIFLDAFQGCYKPNRRYFAGLYFMFRLIMFIAYAFTPSEISYMVWKQALCTVMLVLVSLLKPYRVEFFNIVDTFIFLNLSIINAVSFSMYRENVYSEYPLDLFKFSMALIWLPLLYMLTYLCWLGLRRTRLYSSILRLIALRLCPDIIGNTEEHRPLLSPAATGTLRPNVGSDPLTDSSMFSRAEEANRYQAPSETKATRSVVDVDGIAGTANVYGTNVTGSSGFSSAGSKTAGSSSRSSGSETD